MGVRIGTVSDDTCLILREEPERVSSFVKKSSSSHISIHAIENASLDYDLRCQFSPRAGIHRFE